MLDDRGLAEIMLAYEIEAREQIDMINRILAEASYAPQMLEAREAHVRSEAYWRSVLERSTVRNGYRTSVGSQGSRLTVAAVVRARPPPQ